MATDAGSSELDWKIVCKFHNLTHNTYSILVIIKLICAVLKMLKTCITIQARHLDNSSTLMLIFLYWNDFKWPLTNVLCMKMIFGYANNFLLVVFSCICLFRAWCCSADIWFCPACVLPPLYKVRSNKICFPRYHLSI